MSVAPHVLLIPHSPSKGLKTPKKTCFVCKSETHLIKDCDFHARKLAQNSYATRDIHKHHAPMIYSRIPLHKVSATAPSKSQPVLTTAARTLHVVKPKFSKARPNITPYDVSKTKSPFSRPFIRHPSPKPSIFPPRVNAANPSTVSAARVNAANLSAVSAARVKAAVSTAKINVVKPFAVTVVQHNHTKKVWRPKTLVLDYALRTTSASMTLKRFNYNDALGRSKSTSCDTINAAAGGTFMKRRPEECYDLIENMTTHHNYWDTSANGPPLAKPRTYMLREPIKVNFQNQNKNQGNNHGIPQGNNQGRNQFFQGANRRPNPPPTYQASAYQALGYQALVHQPLIPQPQVVTTTEFTNYMKENDAILKNMQTNMTSLTNSNLELKKMFGQFMKTNTASSSGSRTLLSNTITNPKEDLKGITTRSGTAYKGPTIPTTSPSSPKVVEHETEVTKDTVPPTNNGNTKDVQPLVVQIEIPKPNSKPVIAPVIEPVVAPISAPKPNQKPSIPNPSRLHNQKLRDKDIDQKEKFFQIFTDLDFNISFTDALCQSLARPSRVC
nr:reverse transcriptase domain-containing protein [Tanacetum cinerariifolium]